MRNCYWDKLEGFRGTSHHWTYNHAHVYCVITLHHQNTETSSFLEHYFRQFWKTATDMNFKVFVEATIYESIIMLMTFSLFPHQNKKIIVCLNAECFYLFDKLLLTWNSRFLWKQPPMWWYVKIYHFYWEKVW